MAVQTVDTTKTEQFLGKVLTDTSAFTTIVLAAVGDRLGLYKELAAGGPATSAELAVRSRIAERYAREWLGAMASAGYLVYDPGDQRFTLPAEYSPIIAQEGGPYFFGGIHQMLLGMSKPVDRLIESFKTGDGIVQSAYDDDMWDGLERFTNGWFENLLLPVWIPAMPEVEAKLRKGARVADVGCGRGRALIKGFSVLYCMTTSLAGHGDALGTVGLPESKLRELSTRAGFSGVRRVPLENPFNNLYELRP